jgi:PAS domain S-box-containing protein
MKMKWADIKRVKGAMEDQPGMFLSVVDDRGSILCANATMKRALQMKNPREASVSFYDLLHPLQLDHFKNALSADFHNGHPLVTELYIKNGYFHPMKWQINRLPGLNGKKFLCAGHYLVEDERLETFNRLGEKNYQLIVEGMNAGVLFQDAQGELISANQKCAEIFNTTLERLYSLKDIGSNWDSTWMIRRGNGERVPFQETPFMRALHSGVPQAETLHVMLSNGEYRWVHFSSQALVDSHNGQAFAIVTDLVDMTREKELSIKLQEKESLFNVFMRHTPNLVWVIDEDENLVFASRSFFKYFGAEEYSSIGKKLVSIVPKEVADTLYKKHIEVLQTGIRTEAIEKVKWSDGTRFVFHINIFPVESMGGKKMVGGYAVNIADKYAIEKQLRETHDRFLLLSRATSDAIWEWDMQTGQIFRNDALMDMIGYQPVDSKGLSWWLRRIHPEDRNRVSDKVKICTDEGRQTWEDEYRFKCADGVYKHMHDKGFIVYENGLPVKMIGSLQDISNLKELEGLLVTEKLERQKEISETVIRVQEKERTRIGHEMHDNVNQILSTVKLFVDMIVPADRDGAELKKKSVEYLLSAIEEIRKLSKELVVPKLKSEKLVDSIRNILDDILISGVMDIRFTYDHENELLSPGKKVTIFRIVQEQLKNILKYSRAKKAEILMQTKGNELQLVIKDNGVGFDPKQITRGIGLSNIHDRVRFYNGTVDIQSAPGKGCLLTVTLPVND